MILFRPFSNVILVLKVLCFRCSMMKIKWLLKGASTKMFPRTPLSFTTAKCCLSNNYCIAMPEPITATVSLICNEKNHLHTWKWNKSIHFHQRTFWFCFFVYIKRWIAFSPYFARLHRPIVSEEDQRQNRRANIIQFMVDDSLQKKC